MPRDEKGKVIGGRKRFRKDVELDAFLVATGFKYGRDAILQAAFLRRDAFPGGPDAAMARGEWLKGQPKAYREAVIAAANVVVDQI